MSTPAVVSDPQPVTVNNTQAEILAAAQAAAALPVDAPVAPTEPVAAPVAPPAPTDKVSLTKLPDGSYEAKLSTGETFKGDPETVIRNIASSKVDTTLYARDLKTKAEALQPPAPPTPAAPALSEIEQQNEAARKVLMDEVAKGFKFKDADEMISRFSSMSEMTEAQRADRSVATFMAACPEFPNTKEAGDSLTEAMASFGGDPYNPEHLKLAHAACVQFGKYKALTQDEIRQSTVRGAEVTHQPKVPPTIASGSPDSSAPKQVTVNNSADEILAAFKAEQARQR